MFGTATLTRLLGCSVSCRWAGLQIQPNEGNLSLDVCRSEAYDQADFVYVFVRAVGEGGQQVGREADAADRAFG